MPVCPCCKAPFPALPASAWGEATCGDCIAARIELMLTDGLPVRIRRPMRRAGDLLDPATSAPPTDVPQPRRSVG